MGRCVGLMYRQLGARDMKGSRISLLVLFAVAPGACGQVPAVYPGREWAAKQPAEVDLSAEKLKAFSDYVGGFGCVVRHGYMVYTWGDASRRMDVASAAKPVYAHFLFKAVENKRIPDFDEMVSKWEPRLKGINEALDYKDSRITWRHMANQISCYGLVEEPWTAYAYNDWQMALLWDTLFTEVYGATYSNVDSQVLHPLLTDLIGYQDNPTFMAFGEQDRPGRLGISPRDFARFGLLYLRGGAWNGKQLLSPEHARMAVTSPVPNAIPRAGNEPAEMIQGQRTMGSKVIPDNQTDHMGSYSWLWWINGVDREGKRHWASAPVDTYGCFGHGGKRAMIVLPSLDLIVSWNDTRIDGREMENAALSLLLEAVAGPKSLTEGGPHDLGTKATQMWECTEWGLPDVAQAGNPFDAAAAVTFHHWDSGVERTTQMFHDGNNTWRFRFTGTRAGKWTFTTASSVAALDGYVGAIHVEHNSDSKIKGFLTHVGNKYAIQVRDETDLHGYLFNVFMNRVKYPAYLEEFGSDLNEVAVKAKACFEDAQANGFEIIFVHMNNNWFKFGVREHNKHSSVDPDPATFRVLETIIRTVHAAGGRVHIWAWGDESRKWTPKGVPGGINGEADRRLQRYIAARLAPLPGWTMGYGFDLHEWTNETELNAWAKCLHDHMGWQHLLCARGYRLQGPYNINSYDGFGRNVPLTTTEHGPQNFLEVGEDFISDPTRPHLYEERHSYLREGFKLDMDGTRRLLWWEAMTGGMGGFFGFYPDSPYPYPNPEQLRTHYDFWHQGGRFLPDMKVALGLVEGRCSLWSPSAQSGVFYREDTDSITVDLPVTTVPQPVVAFDTKKGAPVAQPVTISPAGTGRSMFKAPYRSDWVFAAGQFAQPGQEPPDNFWGRIAADPEHPQWPRHMPPSQNTGHAFLMCGPGDPEDFLYRGTLNPDGTRTGDQMQLIGKLKGTGANCIYLMAVRSHGGDGDATHNPFIDHDPAKAVNPDVLDQWDEWFAEMDRNRIVIYLFIYDDSARPWNTGDQVGEQERQFIKTLVNRFEHHGHLIWCIAEEYAERLTAERVRRIAALIRAEDEYGHPIAVHKNHGLDFSEFADDPSIDQFAIQYNVKTAEELHAGVVQAWRDAKGRYSLNLAEAANWGTGAESRKKCWACAMGGASVMILGMDIASTPASDLGDCGNVVRFFEMVDLDGMEPHDELAYAGTQYVLAKPGERYVAYASAGNQISITGVTPGNYAFHWFDCVTGNVVTQEKVQVVPRGRPWAKPAGIGPEVAVYIRPADE